MIITTKEIHLVNVVFVNITVLKIDMSKIKKANIIGFMDLIVLMVTVVIIRAIFPHIFWFTKPMFKVT